MTDQLTAIRNTESESYFSDLEEYNDEEIGLVVSADNYHTYVTKEIELDINTSYGAENNFDFTVYLCPLGTSCIRAF